MDFYVTHSEYKNTQFILVFKFCKKERTNQVMQRRCKASKYLRNNQCYDSNKSNCNLKGFEILRGFGDLSSSNRLKKVAARAAITIPTKYQNEQNSKLARPSGGGWVWENPDIASGNVFGTDLEEIFAPVSSSRWNNGGIQYYRWVKVLLLTFLGMHLLILVSRTHFEHQSPFPSS